MRDTKKKKKKSHRVGDTVLSVRPRERLGNGVDGAVGGQRVGDGEPLGPAALLPEGGAEGGPALRQAAMEVGHPTGEAGEGGGNGVEFNLERDMWVGELYMLYI